jgi:hypothetical protein
MSVWVLASNSNSDVHLEDITPELAIAAGAAIGAWLLLLGLFALFTRPREVPPAPATMDLGPEPPAVVDYLFSRFHVTNHGVAGTLLDLAAGHYVDIDQQPGGTFFSAGREAPDRLLPHERMLYDHVVRLAGSGSVPAQALTLGSAEQSAGWLKRFDGLVSQYSRSNGLTVARFGFATWGIIRLTGLVAAGLVIATAAQANATEVGFLACGMALVFSHAALEKVFGTQKLTPAGEQAVAHWLGVKEYLSQGEGFHDLPAAHVILWDRYMAYAAAMGLARAAARALPLGAEDDHKAWSDYTGTWRQVTVRYPHHRFLWGRSPLNVLFIGLFTVAIGAAGIYGAIQVLDYADGLPSSDEAAYWISQGSLIAIAVFAFVCFWGLTTINLASMDFGTKRTLQGLAVRCRTFPHGDNKTDYFIGIDDGVHPEIKAWLVSPATYNAVGEGAVVTARVSRCQAHIYELTVTKAGPEPIVVEAPEVKTIEAPRWLSGLIAAAQTGAPATDPATLVTEDELAGVLGEPVTSEHVGEALAFGPMRAARYKTASGASIDIRVAGGAFVNVFKSVSLRWTNRDHIGGMDAMIKDDALLLLGKDNAVIVQLEGGKIPDRGAALRQIATIVAGRLQAGVPVTTQQVS